MADVNGTSRDKEGRLAHGSNHVQLRARKPRVEMDDPTAQPGHKENADQERPTFSGGEKDPWNVAAGYTPRHPS